jgi:hypothetical protein
MIERRLMIETQKLHMLDGLLGCGGGARGSTWYSIKVQYHRFTNRVCPILNVRISRIFS